MSYTTGMNSYYTFTPHEIMSGFGRTAMNSYYTFTPHEIMSRSRPVLAGFGSVAETFNPDQVMSYIAESDKCYGPNPIKGYSQGACNLAGQRANKEIQVALNELGYGPIAVDGSLNWQGAYAQFLADHGLTKGPGFGITKQALVVMQQELRAGNTPGGNPPVEYEKVGGEYVPTGRTKLTKQSKIALGLLAVGAVAALGIVAYKKKKKKHA